MTGRNHPCPCHSGRKYKLCCLDKIKVIDCPCEVRPSLLHGNGVFATRDIKKGEYLCTYGGTRVVGRSHIIDWKYVFTINDESETFLIGCDNIVNSHEIAQFINDGDKLDIKSASDLHSILTDICNYYATSLFAKNCVISNINETVNAIAFKDICEGEEILWTYDHNYWISNYCYSPITQLASNIYNKLLLDSSKLVFNMPSNMRSQFTFDDHCHLILLATIPQCYSKQNNIKYWQDPHIPNKYWFTI